MKLFIDWENFLSLLDARTKREQDFKECQRLLFYHFQIHYNFPNRRFNESSEGCSMSEDSTRDDESKIAMWFMESSVGRSMSEDSTDEFSENPNDVLPKRPLMSNFYQSNFDYVTAVFLLNDNSDIISKLQEQNSILIGTIGEEIDTLKKLFCDLQTYELYKEYNIQDENNFPGWDKLKEHTLPCTDIFIMDRYILKDTELIQPNLYSLISVLTAKCQCAINIVILTLYPKHWKDNKVDKDSVQNFQDSNNKIYKNLLASLPKNSSISIFYDDKFYPEFHDRKILTNYLLLESGDSFNYYDKTGKIITKGDTLLVFSLSASGKFKSAHDLISKKYEILKKIEKYIKSINGNRIQMVYHTDHANSNFFDLTFLQNKSEE